MDINAAFHNTYRNVTVFEQKYGVQLPEDIVVLLTSEVEPDDANTFNARGVAYGENGDFDKAIEAFTKAIELSSEDAGVYYNRGFVYCNQEKFREAINDFSVAIDLKLDGSTGLLFPGFCSPQLTGS